MSVTFQATNLPTRAALWHDESTVTAGNALSVVADTSQWFGVYAYQNAAVNGDSFTQSLWLRQGMYMVTFLGETDSGSGRVDWSLDGTVFAAGQDWYSASLVRNVQKTATLTILTDGYHTLKAVLNGKNGSSSGYKLLLTRIAFRQAGD
jgi:hypothetical protein